jgi:hypothetical protein
VRDALSDQVTVVLDERDQTALEDQEGEVDNDKTIPAIETVQASRKVRMSFVRDSTLSSHSHRSKYAPSTTSRARRERSLFSLSSEIVGMLKMMSLETSTVLLVSFGLKTGPTLPYLEPGKACLFLGMLSNWVAAARCGKQ